MVEILIALLIGLFVIAGVISIVQGTRITSGNQNSLSQLQDNQRFAFSMLSDVVQTAGYFPVPAFTQYTAALPVSGTTFPTAGQAISGTHANGTAAPGDTLTLRYLTASGDNVLNCSGASNTSGAQVMYVNVLAINASNQLTCAVNGGTAIPLVNGVSNMQILYGVNTQNPIAAGALPTTRNVDTYMYASAMSAANWLNVTSLQITLTFINPLCPLGVGTPSCQAGQQGTIQVTTFIGVMNQAGVTT